MAIGRSMGAQLAHRGPDDSGQWVDDSGRCVLGHRRLAIVELSALGHQPMVSASGRYTLVFNGEIYNHRELRRDLEALGCQFRGGSDTEVLLAGFDTWGMESTLKHCHGMFAIALWDRRELRVQLARDRFGEKPLYVWRNQRGLSFASELKPILLANDFQFEPDIQSLGMLLRYGYVPDTMSIVKGVTKVQPGTIETWCIRNDQLVQNPLVARYWALGPVSMDSPPTEQEAETLLHAELRRATSDQMLADVPVGCFLSGGVDSTTVATVMQSLSSRSIRTFCVAFDDPQYDEGPYARRVANHLKTSHTEVRICKSALIDIVRDLPSIYDEPLADPSQIPTVAVARAAREHVKVCLSGDGGDEVFGGYNRYYWPDRIRRQAKWWPVVLRSAVANLLVSLGRKESYAAIRALLTQVIFHGKPVQDLGGKLVKAGNSLRVLDPAQVYLDLIYRCPDPRAYIPDWLPLDDAEDRLRGLMRTMSSLDAATQWDIEHYLPGDNLVKVDRASMAVGLEMRAPLLDHRVVEFGRAMMNWFGCVRYEREPKWPLRNLVRLSVPDELVNRPKMGFSVPIAEWLRTDLRDWTIDTLSHGIDRYGAAFDVAAVRKLLDEHMRGAFDRSMLLWSILSYAAWAHSISQRS
jgi:asparagine synthase (glutamine-hydrolysing)